jgi:hypothetical protein
MRHSLFAVLVPVLLLFLARPVAAQEDVQKRLDQLAKRVDQLEAKQRQPVSEIHREAGGTVLFLFGAFCALWAQNTNRDPWLWFFLGLLFNVVTVLVLLAKNADDRRQARGEPPASGSLMVLAVIAGILVLAAAGTMIYWLVAT